MLLSRKGTWDSELGSCAGANDTVEAWCRLADSALNDSSSNGGAASSTASKNGANTRHPGSHVHWQEPFNSSAAALNHSSSSQGQQQQGRDQQQHQQQQQQQGRDQHQQGQQQEQQRAGGSGGFEHEQGGSGGGGEGSQAGLQAPDFTMRQLARVRRLHRLQTPTLKAASKLASEYDIRDEIGQGAFGTVSLAAHRATQEQVVVKQVDTGTSNAFEMAMKSTETKVLAALAHPNVVRYLDCYGDADKGQLHIVMEYCSGGDLNRYIHSAAQEGRELEENEVMLKFVQVALALEYVHSHGVLHRDLKTSNIFLCSDGLVKIGDFGICKILNPDEPSSSAGGNRSSSGATKPPSRSLLATHLGPMARSFVGTVGYMAPEICENKPYGQKADVWALGCVLYELCALKPAFRGRNIPTVLRRVMRGFSKQVPSRYSSHVQRLVTWLLHKKARCRPTVSELLQDDYVRSFLVQYEQAHPEAVQQLPFGYTLDALAPRAAASSGGGAHQSRRQSHAGHHPHRLSHAGSHGSRRSSHAGSRGSRRSSHAGSHGSRRSSHAGHHSHRVSHGGHGSRRASGAGSKLQQHSHGDSGSHGGASSHGGSGSCEADHNSHGNGTSGPKNGNASHGGGSSSHGDGSSSHCGNLNMSGRSRGRGSPHASSGGVRIHISAPRLLLASSLPRKGHRCCSGGGAGCSCSDAGCSGGAGRCGSACGCSSGAAGCGSADRGHGSPAHKASGGHACSLHASLLRSKGKSALSRSTNSNSCTTRGADGACTTRRGTRRAGAAVEGAASHSKLHSSSKRLQAPNAGDTMGTTAVAADMDAAVRCNSAPRFTRTDLAGLISLSPDSESPLDLSPASSPRTASSDSGLLYSAGSSSLSNTSGSRGSSGNSGSNNSSSSDGARANASQQQWQHSQKQRRNSRNDSSDFKRLTSGLLVRVRRSAGRSSSGGGRSSSGGGRSSSGGGRSSNGGSSSHSSDGGGCSTSDMEVAFQLPPSRWDRPLDIIAEQSEGSRTSQSSADPCNSARSGEVQGSVSPDRQQSHHWRRLSDGRIELEQRRSAVHEMQLVEQEEEEELQRMRTSQDAQQWQHMRASQDEQQWQHMRASQDEQQQQHMRTSHDEQQWQHVRTSHDEQHWNHSLSDKPHCIHSAHASQQWQEQGDNQQQQAPHAADGCIGHTAQRAEQSAQQCSISRSAAEHIAAAGTTCTAPGHPISNMVGSQATASAVDGPADSTPTVVYVAARRLLRKTTSDNTQRRARSDDNSGSGARDCGGSGGSSSSSSSTPTPRRLEPNMGDIVTTLDVSRHASVETELPECLVNGSSSSKPAGRRAGGVGSRMGAGGSSSVAIGHALGGSAAAGSSTADGSGSRRPSRLPSAATQAPSAQQQATPSKAATAAKVSRIIEAFNARAGSEPPARQPSTKCPAPTAARPAVRAGSASTGARAGATATVSATSTAATSATASATASATVSVIPTANATATATTSATPAALQRPSAKQPAPATSTRHHPHHHNPLAQQHRRRSLDQPRGPRASDTADRQRRKSRLADASSPMPDAYAFVLSSDIALPAVWTARQAEGVAAAVAASGDVALPGDAALVANNSGTVPHVAVHASAADRQSAGSKHVAMQLNGSDGPSTAGHDSISAYFPHSQGNGDASQFRWNIHGSAGSKTAAAKAAALAQEQHAALRALQRLRGKLGIPAKPGRGVSMGAVD